MSSPTQERSRSAVDGSAIVPEQVARGVDVGWGGRGSGRVRPAGRPATGSPTRPAARRDACRPAGRPAALVVPPAPPLPSAGRVNRTDVIHVAPARVAVLRRRRAVAVVVLAAVLVALLALAVRLGGEVAADVPGAEPVPAGSTVAVVAPGETLLEVAERVAPGADPAAVAERIREVNRLSSSLVAPGRPLVVPAGG
ncbi:hypothetical protein WCD74_09440 [Actinomycetospora sp. OC33-EN08]|uniref:LysM domain-containing protein n=1 Tax=Actinomycetospora aurantiaca TaxID=3129233 RepID=A0ABU8ML56_9PSEU